MFAMMLVFGTIVSTVSSIYEGESVAQLPFEPDWSQVQLLHSALVYLQAVCKTVQVSLNLSHAQGACGLQLMKQRYNPILHTFRPTQDADARAFAQMCRDERLSHAINAPDLIHNGRAVGERLARLHPDARWTFTLNYMEHVMLAVTAQSHRLLPALLACAHLIR